jgi:hypothetical protein
MLFRTLDKKNFRTLVERILESNEVIGPKVVGTDREGRPIHQLLPIEGFDEMDLDSDLLTYPFLEMSGFRLPDARFWPRG